MTWRRLAMGIVLGMTWITTPLVAQAAIGSAPKILAELTADTSIPRVVPAVTERTLSNGMRCYFLEDPFLPLFRFYMIFPGGMIYDPPDKVGLSEMLAGLLRSGGTKQRTADQLDTLLDNEAIEIAFDMRREYGTVELKAMAESRDHGVNWLLEMIYAPAFESKRVEIVRNELLEEIRRQNDDPDDIGDRIFRKLLYGMNSPWAWTPRADQVLSMTRDDFKVMHATLFAPNEMFCAAAGDFDTDALVRRLESEIAKYPERRASQRTPPPASRARTTGLWLRPKALPQSVINVGHLSLSRDNPDKFAFTVMNSVLGSPSTFTSWLIQRIRTERGLAYEAWSQLYLGPSKVPGIFWAHSKTRAAATGETVGLIDATIAEMAQAKAVKKEEVEAMKTAILKRLIFQYEDAYDVVSDMARFVFYGFPADYIEVYRDKIARVTHEDVKQVAQKYLHPDQLTILVVGDPAKVAPQLEGFGPVQRIMME